jgi:hypothetical protein
MQLFIIFFLKTLDEIKKVYKIMVSGSKWIKVD